MVDALNPKAIVDINRGKWRVTTEHGTTHLFDFDRHRYTRLPIESPNHFPDDGTWRRIYVRPDPEVGRPLKVVLSGGHPAGAVFDRAYVYVKENYWRLSCKATT